MLPLRPEWTCEWWQWRGTPHSPKLQHYWILTIRSFSVMSGTLVLTLCREAVGVFYSPSLLSHQDIRWGSLTPLQRSSRCILQPQLIGPPGTLVGGVLLLCRDRSRCILQPQLIEPPGHSLGSLPLCREAVGVFYSPSLLGHQGHSLGESYPSAEKQSVYSTAPAYWHQDTRWGSLTPLQRSDRCILQPQLIGPPGHSQIGVLPSAEKQSVYSTAPAYWATRTLAERSLTPLQRSNRCILQPQLTGPPGHLLGESYPLQRSKWRILHPQPTGLLFTGSGFASLLMSVIRIIVSNNGGRHFNGLSHFKSSSSDMFTDNNHSWMVSLSLNVLFEMF